MVDGPPPRFVKPPYSVSLNLPALSLASIYDVRELSFFAMQHWPLFCDTRFAKKGRSPKFDVQKASHWKITPFTALF